MSQKQYGEVNPKYLKIPGNSYYRPEVRDLKIIGVEEHVAFPDITGRVPKNTPAVQHALGLFEHLIAHEAMGQVRGRLTDMAGQRLKDMDDAGVAMQILSYAGGVNSTHMDPEAGLALARDVNDSLKKGVDANPTRFVALAELPMQAPKLAIQELRRAVQQLGFKGALFNGSVGGTGEFLDGDKYDELLSTFEELDVPLFLHPGIPPKAVTDTYYTIRGNDKLSAVFAASGWGWHNEVAVHTIRLCIAGALDRHPRLKIVIGHQGEMMPMMMQRFDTMFNEEIFGFKRSVGEMMRSQVWICISGLFSIPPTLAAIQTWGVDRVLFANDYPFIDADRLPEYVRALGDVVGPSDLRKICQTNAEQLFNIKA